MRFIVGRFTSFSSEIELLPKIFLYSIEIKEQTRKLAAGCSKHGFEVVDKATLTGLKRFSKSINH
ncbi:chlorohydrolase [Streptococcus pneumoniae]|uniref:chlorohydrolase n=1 Tax=Streptococcus pneumoniae TaxID=1313 RepID=UPI000999988D|nr:chlorohydrolase [Streptococcus pneumoniae]